MHAFEPVKIFDPRTLDKDKTQRLEELLDDLDLAVKERKKALYPGYHNALDAWLENPDMRAVESYHSEVLSVLPEERLFKFLEQVFQSFSRDGQEDLVNKLKPLNIEEQRDVLAFMISYHQFYLERDIDRKHWKRLNSLYRTILREYPDILNNESDISGAIRFGELIQKEKRSLTEIWRQASLSEQVKKAHQLLADAYPDDDVGNLFITSIDNKLASFFVSMAADAIVCGDTFSGGKHKRWDSALYSLAHEFQHRRQVRLVDEFKKGNLEKESSEYYQARLYDIQNKGGSLVHFMAKNGLEMVAKAWDYRVQPIERHADGMAKLSSVVGNTHAAARASRVETIDRIFSAVTKPIDTAYFHIKNVASRRHYHTLDR